MFIEGVSNVAETPVTFEKWGITGAGDKPAEVDESGVKPVKYEAVTTADHSNPAWIAQRAGFHVGTKVFEKANAPATMFNGFVIESINNMVVLKRMECYDVKDTAHFKSAVTLSELLSEWAASNVQMPVKMDSHEYRPKSLQLELTKVKLFTALMDVDAAAMNKAASSLIFWRKPDLVRSGSQKITDLKLAPCAPISNICTKGCSDKAVSLGCHKSSLDDDSVAVEWFVIEPSKAPVPTEKKPDISAYIMAAYWWVGTTTNKREANMEFDFKEIRGITIPILKNSCDIQPNTRLLRFSPAPKPAGQPKKKSRTSL